MEDWQTEQLVENVRDGAVFIYPTDSYFGLGCSIYSTEALDMVYRIKGRSEDRPVPILLDQADLDQLVSPEAVEQQAIDQFWPGDLTLVIETDQPDSWDQRLVEDGSMVLRSPGLEPLRDFLARVGPIVVTGANVDGKPAPARLEDVHPQLLSEVDFVLGDSAGEGELSTVAGWDPSTKEWIVYRPGSVWRDQLPVETRARS